MRYFHAPGRVNLIGEHTDYNGGFVLPYALKMGTTAAVREVSGEVRFTSENGAGDWAKYPQGMLQAMQEDGRKAGGFHMHFTGDVPQGSGLSSSASLLMATGAALNTVFDMGYTAEQLAKLAQKTENEYIGVNCGIMDMFVSGLGRRGHGIYLNCGTMEYDYVPLNFGDFGIIIMDTKKPRALVESKYNERLDECKRGVEKRMRHVKSENERVGEAAAALRSGDMPALGRLFGASHASLRDDYEVSCRELDVLVGEAEKHPACRGARMTGAGFGGCAIALVARAEAEDFTAQVSAAYTKQIGYAPAMYSGESGDGGREIENGELRMENGEFRMGD